MAQLTSTTNAAEGSKIARIEPYDVRAHLSGNRVDGSQTGVWGVYVLPLLNSSVTIRSGDMLAFRMYQNNAAGGISLGFTDGSNSDWYCGVDQNGACLHSFNRYNQWATRIVNLGAFAVGKSLSSIVVEDDQGAPQGNFDVMVADMNIIRADGTVIPLLGRTNFQTLPPYSAACNEVNAPYGWPLSCTIEQVTSTTDFAGPPATTIYAVGDHLGTAQLEFSSGGWPIWQGQFAPFGREIDTQATTNHYKFTGKERDTESGLDYFGARYYASNMGRWMSPDWSAKQDPVPYAKLDNPQSLNLYSYVGNNPLSRVDPDGHEDLKPKDWVPPPPTPAQKDAALPKPDADHNHTIVVREVAGQHGNPAGHVTVQVDGGKEVGFGPVNTKGVLGNASVPGQIEPRAPGVKTLDAVTINVTAAQAGAANQTIADRTANPGNYQLVGNSCVNFGEQVMSSAGAPTQNVTTPGGLVQVVRDQQYHDNTTQTPR